MNHHYLFVSAHLDDAIISCGDYIDSLVRAGHRVTVATVFTDTGTDLSLLARILHKKFGLSSDVMKARREEDLNACGILAVDTIHLDLQECIYRKDRSGAPSYTKLEDLFRGDYETELDVISKAAVVLSTRLCLTDYDRIYIPLAIGRHVDHGIVRIASEQATQSISDLEISTRLIYYEDLPYLIYGQDTQWENDLVHNLHPVYISLPRCSLKQKTAAILAYQSQIRLLWHSRREMLRQVVQHAHKYRPPGLRLEPSTYCFRLHAVGAPDQVPLATHVSASF
ncbi:hypothetical protein AMQ83_29645 [Paenibacillus riograndensis]|nr:hypothetical protein AMQ83_29645 [Paenibacillus riograndensis]